MSIEHSGDTSLSAKPFIFPEEIEFLQNLIMNSDLFVFRDPKIRTLTKRRAIREPDSLKVLLLSFKLPDPIHYRHDMNPNEKYPYNGEPHYEYIKFDDNDDILSREDIKEIVRSCIEYYHHEDDPLHFLLMNELSLAYSESTQLISSINQMFLDNNNQTTIGILGSYHCDDTYSNISPLVSPFMKKDSFEHQTVYKVYKQHSAIKQDEHIRTPDGTYFIKFKTPYGNIMDWICLDMYDPNLVLKLIRTNYRLSLNRQRENSNDDFVDILFIPSYNIDFEQHVQNVTQFISKYGRLTVFLCNDSTYYDNGKGWNKNLCFHFGNQIDVESDGNDVPVDPNKCSVSVFRIPDWRNRFDLVSGPYTTEFSSLFAQLLGLGDSSFKPI